MGFCSKLNHFPASYLERDKPPLTLPGLLRPLSVRTNYRLRKSKLKTSTTSTRRSLSTSPDLSVHDWNTFFGLVNFVVPGPGKIIHLCDLTQACDDGEREETPVVSNKQQ